MDSWIHHFFAPFTQQDAFISVKYFIFHSVYHCHCPNPICTYQIVIGICTIKSVKLGYLGNIEIETEELTWTSVFVFILVIMFKED